MDAHVIIGIFKDHAILEKSRQTHINRHLSILHIRSLPFEEPLGENIPSQTTTLLNICKDSDKNILNDIE